MGSANGKEDQFNSNNSSFNETSKKLKQDEFVNNSNLKEIFEKDSNLGKSRKTQMHQTILKGIPVKEVQVKAKKVKEIKSSDDLTSQVNSNKNETSKEAPPLLSLEKGSSSTNSKTKQTLLYSKLGMAIVKKYNSKLTLNDIHTQVLRTVFRKDMKAIKQEIRQLQGSHDTSSFEYEMTVAFWLAIHLEYLDLSNYLIKKIPLLKKIVASSLKKKQDNRLVSQYSRANTLKRMSKKSKVENENDGYNEDGDADFTGLIIQKKALKDEEDDTLNATPDKFGTSPIKSKGSIRKQMAKIVLESDSLDNLIPTEFKVNTEVAESLFSHFEDKSQLIELKEIMKNEFPTLMTNILKIILGKQEEKLAQVIVAYYKASITEEILVKAIETNQFEFLYYMFGFGKNFLYDQQERISTQITFQMLFKYIRVLKPNFDEFKELIKDVCEWKISNTTDNLLLALLTFQLDDLALQYMGNNGNNLNEALLIYCLDVQNQKFLIEALKLRAFDKLIFREDSTQQANNSNSYNMDGKVIVAKLLNYLNDGTRTNYVLGILQLIDISIWKNRQLKEALEIFSSFAEQNYEHNKLILSYNPVLTIGLACETLKKISYFRKKFENECKRISNQMLSLGEMYLSKIQDELYYEKLMMDPDSKERSVLKIITENNFEKLMDEKDPKAENLMNKIWKGKEATNCDGNIFGYSSLSTVVFKSFTRLNATNRDSDVITLASNSFEPNFKVDYIFQHRYRSRAISFYFLKEFLCAFLMLVIFQWINYQYLIEVNLINDIEKVDNGDADNSDEYSQLQSELFSLQDIGSIIFNLGNLAYIFAFALIFQLMLKIIFNIFAKEKITLDRWTVIDSITAFLNIIAVQVIKRVKISDLIDPLVKDTLDYFMIFVLTISWIRFFMYFLVVRTISKLLLTLIEMVEDTISFIFIVSCFIIIMSSIFTTLYQDVNPEKFGALTLTIRTLFDAMMSVYSYDNMGGRELSYSILIIFHVFFSNVLLLNYLIAILSTTYENMKQSGIFKYKKNLFYYCERFVIAFDDEFYGELILHPPPLSYLCMFILPFIKRKEQMKKVQKMFSLMMFWIENTIIVLIFFLYEILLVPFAYLKTALNIFHILDAGFLRKIAALISWFLCGIFIDIFLVYKDLTHFFKIICQVNGFQDCINKQFQEDTLNIKTQIDVLNLARDSVIRLFKTLKYHFKGEIDEREKTKKKQKSNKKNNNTASNINQLNINNLSRSDNQSSYISQSYSRLMQRSGKSSQNIEEDMKIKEDKSSSSSFELSDIDDSDIENFNIVEELEFLEMNAGYNPNDSNCLYVVKKNVILQDWIIRRRLQIEEKIQSKKQNPQFNTDMFKEDLKSEKRSMSLFVQNEDSKLIDKFQDLVIEEEENEDDLDKGMDNKSGKKFFSRRKSKIIFLDHLLNNSHMKAQASFKSFGATESQGKTPSSKMSRQFLDRTLTQKKDVNLDFDLDLSPLEIKCVTQFFNNFVIVSETSLQEHIDIVLFLRALPERITMQNIDKVKLFNFKVCQESLIAYQNLDLVNAFEYFDDKNRERVQQVKEKLSEQKSSLSEIREIVRFIKRKMYNHERRSKEEEKKGENGSDAYNKNSNKKNYGGGNRGMISPKGSHASQSNLSNLKIFGGFSGASNANNNGSKNPGINPFQVKEEPPISKKKSILESSQQYEFN